MNKLLRAFAPSRESSSALQPFLGNLDTFAELPGGVGKLRGLILDLAVRGKLVEQDYDDEPASELLERIKVRRRDLVKAGVIRPGAAARNTALPDEPLPPGWIWAKFADVTFNRDSDRIPVRKADRENQQKLYDYYGASGVRLGIRD